MTDGVILGIVTAVTTSVQTIATLYIRSVVNKNACGGENCRKQLQNIKTDALQSKSDGA